MCAFTTTYAEKNPKAQKSRSGLFKPEVLISIYGEVNNTFVLFYQRKLD